MQSPMRVLDLDLDFFLDNVHTSVHVEDRLSNEHFQPWDEENVRLFLETRCLLSRNKPTLGRVVKLHHEAFLYWRYLLNLGLLTAPFDVTHVDAHADLGFGDAGWSYIMGDLMHRNVADRDNPLISDAGEGMGEGNYLLFAIACHWINRLNYVMHPFNEDDFPALIFQDRDPDSGFIQLSRVDPDKIDLFMNGNDGVVTDIEQPVPFSRIRCADYQADAPCDFVVLSCSPAYTPRASDSLISVISEYMVI